MRFVDIDYTYPLTDVPALSGLSLDIPPHQKTVILGPNGCGKSTLLSLANGLLQPDRGEIYWQGERLHYGRKSLKRWRQRVGLAFQNPEQQLVAGTVAEDISYGLYNLGLPQTQIRQRVNQALQEFDLIALRDTPLHHLSLGQKRRLALAGVMVMEPELLFLDEPTTFLDSAQTRHFFRELDRIHQAGTTIVMTTHDVNLANCWADWLVILAAGQVLLSGPPETVWPQLPDYPQITLDIPLLWQIWHNLPPSLRQHQALPRTPAQLTQLIHQAWHHRNF